MVSFVKHWASWSGNVVILGRYPVLQIFWHCLTRDSACDVPANNPCKAQSIVLARAAPLVARHFST